ncbi:MAG: aspartate--tRNA ligase [Candidatus Sumerlaeia bacterium]
MVAGLNTSPRSCYCGEVRSSDIDKEITLKGWVHNRRDHGGLIFIDLRDRTGLCQVVLDPSRMNPDKFKQAHSLRSEFVLAIRGKVIPRIEGTVNPNLPTGEIEVEVEEFELLNRSKPVPFKLDEYAHVTEDIRLKFRYLDLRRPEMQRNVMMRAKVTSAVRSYLDRNGFLEIETPILNKSTPEGARDFLVPSRLMPGEFYALPQSPQIFKQILMVSGYDKYYQMAKCFRDEDLRANRQPEFTQIDIEMSFITPEEIYAPMEGMMKHVFKQALDYDVETPFQRMSWADSMLRYGSDKPDLRFGLEIHELTEIFQSGGCDFRVFNTVLESGGVIRGFRVPGGGEMYSTTQLKPEGDLNKTVRTYGAGGMAWFRVEEAGEKAPAGMASNITKFFSEELLGKLRQELGAEEGDLILLVADKPGIAAESLGQLRLKVARDNDLIDKSKPCFCWVTDFPLFEYDEKTREYSPSHHPFTMPHEEDIEHLKNGELGKVRAYAYDLALNGEEVGGGSIRIHNMEIQSLIFKTLGISEEEAQAKFGFLLEALQYGAPPHGGIAFGMDRLMMIILGEDSIREVIPFPKTQTGACLMSGAPSGVASDQLGELNLELLEIEED